MRGEEEVSECRKRNVRVSYKEGAIGVFSCRLKMDGSVMVKRAYAASAVRRQLRTFDFVRWDMAARMRLVGQSRLREATNARTAFIYATRSSAAVSSLLPNAYLARATRTPRPCKAPSIVIVFGMEAGRDRPACFGL